MTKLLNAIFLVFVISCGEAPGDTEKKPEPKPRKVAYNFCDHYETFIDTKRRICWAERFETIINYYYDHSRGYALVIDCSLALECFREKGIDHNQY